MNHEVDDSDMVGEMTTSKCYDGCNFLWDYDYLVGNLDFINKNLTGKNLKIIPNNSESRFMIQYLKKTQQEMC